MRTSKLALSLTCLALLAPLSGCESATRRGASDGAAPTASADSLLADQDGDGTSYDDGDDDAAIDSYGHSAGAVEQQAVAAVVQRYYAAAAAGQGTRACALTYYFDSETLPERYGQPPGPRWLAGANTCSALLERVFTHFHRSLTVPIVVSAIRLNGEHAYALIGSHALSAGYLKLRREGHAWKIDGLLANPLP